MLKGETFDLQTFTSDAFALFIDRFANEQCGVMTGCALSNTANSVTIADGYFLIRGRLLRIISNVTIPNISIDGYYSLICEIDLSKVNTESEFNQGVIKVISSVSNFPTLTQQDITGSGTLYQYEFARFRVSSGSITNFMDSRTYVNYGNILELISTELESLEDLSNVSLKSDFKLLSGTIPNSSFDSQSQIEYITANLPSGFTAENCVVLSSMVSIDGTNQITTTMGKLAVTIDSENSQYTVSINTTFATNYNYKIVLMKIS